MSLSCVETKCDINIKSDLHGYYEVNSDPTEWWKSTVIYEVYIRSFCDSNNDGIGDLNGIKSKLDYFKYLNVETLWITPFYKSPMKDFGYDVSNFVEIDPLFGNMQDFKNLLTAMKECGMKMVMDFVPNHTSDQHNWFQRSTKKEIPYSDYYIWKPMKGKDENGKPILPNNWLSVFGGPAWTFNEDRQEFYLHQFAKEQPDLNYRNPLVIEEMKKVLQFWLDLGVDGFRLDAAPHLLEDEQFCDEKPNTENPEGKFSEEEWMYWDHNNITYDLPGVQDILASFRQVLDSYKERDGFTRVLMIEAYLGTKQLMKYYGTVERPVGHFAFNFALIDLEPGFNAVEVYKMIVQWLEMMTKGCWPNWVIGNHDRSRISSRLGAEFVDSFNMIALLLPGTAVTYYGEELGLQNVNISYEDTVDPAGINAGPSKFLYYSRDPYRSPMLWNNLKHAGFTEGEKTWLPIHKDYKSINVDFQKSTENSHLKIYKKLVKARHDGNIEIRCLNNNLLAFTRIANEGTSDSLLIVTNFGDSSELVDVSCFAHIPDSLTVLLRSVHYQPDTLKIGSRVDSKSIEVGPKSAIVCSFESTSTV